MEKPSLRPANASFSAVSGSFQFWRVFPFAKVVSPASMPSTKRKLLIVRKVLRQPSAGCTNLGIP